MSNQKILLSPYKLGNIELKNRVVMSPMTRSRAIGNIPNDLMVTYYEQRATAGLIITEGVSPSPNGLGYARIPGIFSAEQVAGWKNVTEAVHKKGGKIFIQFMHTGRVGHIGNLPAGAEVLAPSPIPPGGKMWVDGLGQVDHTVPREMNAEDLVNTKNEFVQSAINAIEAGFDGVELHGANGYLLEQFISPITNQRTDNYGGTIENRCRFVIEVAQAVASVIGKEKTAIRLSPYGVNADMALYPEIDETYTYLTKELNKIGLTYIHIVDHSGMGAPVVPDSVKQSIIDNFSNTIIFSGNYKSESAEEVLQSGKAQLTAFGRPFINNPDLVVRFENNYPLNDNLDFKTFYTPGPEGYTDYPFYNEQK